MAHENAPEREAAEIVACECIVLAETKDHLNWELIHEIADKAKGEQPRHSRPPTSKSRTEDEHVTPARLGPGTDDVRALGMPAVLPPPEEEE